MMTHSNTYNPDYAIHPGEILEETLEARNIKKNELAERCGMSVKTISHILNKKAPVTAETAIRLERALGVSADIWNNLDASYRLFEAKVKEKKIIEDHASWVKEFPLLALKKRGIMPNTKDISILTECLLLFFGVSSPQSWEEVYSRMIVLYRKTYKFKDSLKSIVTWLRIGILQAEEIDTEPFNESIFRANLLIIRDMTKEQPEIFEPKMKELCRQSGIALIFVAELPHTHLSGATIWLSKDKALIILSLRHKSDDHFWFTFFHEAGHILLHGRKDVFIDKVDMIKSEKEEEANRFARNFLIPEKEYKNFVNLNKGNFHKEAIEKFAKNINIAPGIIVGRLQHEGLLRYSFQNKLKRKFELIENF